VENMRGSIGKLAGFGLDPGRGEVAVRQVSEQDWANAWKEYYKPFRIGERIVIKPSWEDYSAQKGDLIIELDPGMAFGTGAHETTKMCIEMLEKYINNDTMVYDIGCGSGILSIASSKLGAKRVVGVDIDEVAVKASKENIKISGVSNVEIKHGNMFDTLEAKADIIVANIIADAIIGISGSVPEFLEKGGIFIASGIIHERLSDVKAALTRMNFNIAEVTEMGEWAAVAAIRE
jgi:ribosomal protein L11 methyltransferase